MRDEIKKDRAKGEEPIRLSSLDVLLAALDSGSPHRKTSPADASPHSSSQPATIHAPAGFLLSLPLKNVFRLAKKQSKKNKSRARRGIFLNPVHPTHKGDKHE